MLINVISLIIPDETMTMNRVVMIIDNNEANPNSTDPICALFGSGEKTNNVQYDFTRDGFIDSGDAFSCVS